MTIGVAVVGAGLIGTRRAEQVELQPGARLVIVADVDPVRAESLAGRLGCSHTTDWARALEHPEVDAVVVSVVNKYLSEISIAALECGKAVLCEKPLGRNLSEANAMVEAAERNRATLKVGFNLRFHPGLRAARRLCTEGAIGELFFARSIYGHGGRAGYAAEWRGDADLAGGGELLDQGVHLIDLARWFLGDLEPVAALVPRWFWEIGQLEDNAFLLLSSTEGRVASLHTSWTQWKNRFEFEVVGSEGMLSVRGLGGSYGPETMTLARRQPSGPPEEEVTVFEAADTSWAQDWADFVAAIREGREPEVGGKAGLAVMRIVDAVYQDRAAHPQRSAVSKP